MQITELVDYGISWKQNENNMECYGWDLVLLENDVIEIMFLLLPSQTPFAYASIVIKIFFQRYI